MKHKCLLLILISQVLAFDFLSKELQELFTKNNTDPNDMLLKEIVEEALYEIEVIDITADAKKVADLRMPATCLLYPEVTIDGADKYNKARIITAWADGTLRAASNAGKRGYGLRYSIECVKKPVSTRVGKLLKEQHKVWIRNEGKMNMINNVAVLSDRLKFAKNRDLRLNLFIQVLLIFGFFDLSNPAYCERVIKTVEQNIAYRTFVQSPKTFILPNIDYMITLLIHDPGMRGFRKDEWSTLPNFKLSDHKLSENDQLVIDFLGKISNVPNFSFANLFSKTCKA